MFFRKFVIKIFLKLVKARLWTIWKESMQEKGTQSAVQCSKCYGNFRIV